MSKKPALSTLGAPPRLARKVPHRQNQALTDRRYAAPTQCLEHWAEGLVLESSLVAHKKLENMKAAWVESRLWKERQPACVLDPLECAEILNLTFLSTEVDLHRSWSNVATAQQLHKVLT